MTIAQTTRHTEGRPQQSEDQLTARGDIVKYLVTKKLLWTQDRFAKELVNHDPQGPEKRTVQQSFPS